MRQSDLPSLRRAWRLSSRRRTARTPPEGSVPPHRGRLRLTACRFLTAESNEETTHMAIAFLVIAAVTAIVYVASMLIEDLHDSSGE
jgi:hypothetical protein